MPELPQLSGVHGDSLESVVFNEDLYTRPRRVADHESEIRTLSALVQALADSPKTILQALVDQLLILLHAHSAGISLLIIKDGQERFYWPAVAGQWSSYIGGGTPRNFGPCGDVLDNNSPFLFRHLERRYDYYAAAVPRVEECLLVPFYADGVAVGTLWIVAHDTSRQFDSEDLRLMQSVGRFAAAAYQTVHLVEDLGQKTESLEATEAALRHQLSDLQEADTKLALANADLKQFAYAAGHDLKEPLRNIKLFSEQLVQGAFEKLSEEEQGLGTSIIAGCTRIDTLISQLMKYAYAADGDKTPDEVIDLNLIFDWAIDNLQGAITDSGALITCDPLPKIRAHPEHFVQLFQNLISNSIKYRSDRPPAIHLSARPENAQWHFVLSDNGVGIAAEYHQRIFEAFKRLHGREVSGAGLGLAICRRIVERYGGKIWVESAAGAGANFHFTQNRMTSS